MCGFKIICENKTFYFVIIPSNNNTQPMGYSIEYTSRKECEQAVYAFKKHLEENQINSEKSPFIRIDEDNNSGKYVYKYYGKSEELLFTSRLLTKENAKKAISSIYKNYLHKPIL